MTDSFRLLREQLSRALDWEEAHLGLDKANIGIPADRRGIRPPGFKHSAWQLLEHLRIAQYDLLDFCVNPNYSHDLTWPDDYWPRESSPSDAEWLASLAAVSADREALRTLVNDPSIDLFATVPAGQTGQTYLRAIMLVIDHNAYHLGQIVSVRDALTATS